MIPLYMVPSRRSFLDHCLGTRCEGAYSTMTLNWDPSKQQWWNREWDSVFNIQLSYKICNMNKKNTWEIQTLNSK